VGGEGAVPVKRRDFLQALGLVAALPLVGIGVKKASSVPTILDMVDSGALGTTVPLFPVQRFILKTMYGLELDPKERDYLAFLKTEGRYIPAREGSKETMLVMGRRSGMSYLGQVLQVFEMLKLAQTPQDPKYRFGSVTSITCNKDAARHLLKKYAGLTSRSLLKDRVRTIAHSRVTFEDSEGQRVFARFSSSEARAICGVRSASVIFDNAAYYRDLQEAYYAVSPYQGRITTTTTSNGSEPFQDFYAKAISRGALVMRIPTWEANPLLSRDYDYLVSQRELMGTRDFDLEYGARV
jgi:hypothetical protein